MAQIDAIDALMGFDPTNLNAFQENTGAGVNPNVYKTNPRDSKSDDGVYRCKLRILYDPHNFTESIVTKTEWYCKSANGAFMVNAPVDTKENNRTNPLAIASSKVFLALDGFAERYAEKFYPGDGNADRRATLLNEFNSVTGRGRDAWANKFKGTELGKQILDYAKSTFDHTTSTWVLVQVLEDANKPELEGQYKMMKLPKAIYAKLTAKMNPSAESKKAPVDLMSWVLGYVLDMEVQPGPDDPSNPERKQREISYDLCDFSTDFEPIRKTDNTPLFTDEQMEVLEEFATAKKEAESAKAAKKREEAAAKIAKGSELYNKVRDLTMVAYDYLLNEAKVINLKDEIAYKPWDAEMQKRVKDWIDEVTLVNVVSTPTNTDAPGSQNPVEVEPVSDTQDEVPF